MENVAPVFIHWPEIGQFRQAISNVKHKTTFRGVDANGKAIYVPTPLPTLRFYGTVKLHGTNAAMVFHGERSESLMSYQLAFSHAQSRENIITEEQDNAGFAKFAAGVTAEVKRIAEVAIDSWHTYRLCAGADIPNIVDIGVFGEWCGGSIQKGVALNKLNKMFVVFGVRVKYLDENGTERYELLLPGQWLAAFTEQTRGAFNAVSVYSIWDFPTYTVDIDFENPKLIQNKLIEITTAVEAECPVAAALGQSGVGEGVVWQTLDPLCAGEDTMFKVKGEKHSVTKVKKLVEVDLEKMASIAEFVTATLTEPRLEQGWGIILAEHQIVDQRQIGPFLKWCVNDVLKEESDRMVASGLVKEDVCKALSAKARVWFLEKIAI